MLIDQAEVKIGPGEIGVQFNGFFQVGDGLVGLLQARKRDDPQEMMRSGKTRKFFQRLFQRSAACWNSPLLEWRAPWLYKAWASSPPGS